MNGFALAGPEFTGIKPMHGFPKGKVRVSVRPYELVKVYVRNKDGCHAFTVEERDGKWFPGHGVATNRCVRVDKQRGWNRRWPYLNLTIDLGPIILVQTHVMCEQMMSLQMEYIVLAVELFRRWRFSFRIYDCLRRGGYT